MPQYQTVTALVINKRLYKEKDLFVTLLTPDLGKISVLAKGAQSIKSSRLGSLQLGNTIKGQIYEKNSFLWLSEASTVNPFLQTEKKLVQLNLLFYFLELINLLIAENQDIDGVFEISQKIIIAIENNNFADFIRNEIDLIKTLGFGIPPEVEKFYSQKDYKSAQTNIRRFFESIVEKPLESNKLFK